MDKHDILDKLLQGLGSEVESGITFDYDDFDDGVAYLTTATGDFKVKVEQA